MNTDRPNCYSRLRNSMMAKPMFLKIGRKLHEVASFEQASLMVCAARDELDRRTGLASSAFKNPLIVDESGTAIGYVSYNGRVWPGSEYNADATPLFDPCSSDAKIAAATRIETLVRTAMSSHRSAQ